MYSSSKVFEDIADLRFLLFFFCFPKVEGELVTVRYPDWMPIHDKKIEEKKKKK